jgi:hypothetical protein
MVPCDGAKKTLRGCPPHPPRCRGRDGPLPKQAGSRMQHDRWRVRGSPWEAPPPRDRGVVGCPGAKGEPRRRKWESRGGGRESGRCPPPEISRKVGARAPAVCSERGIAGAFNYRPRAFGMSRSCETRPIPGPASASQPVLPRFALRAWSGRSGEPCVERCNAGGPKMRSQESCGGRTTHTRPSGRSIGNSERHVLALGCRMPRNRRGCEVRQNPLQRRFSLHYGPMNREESCDTHERETSHLLFGARQATGLQHR